MNTRPNPTPELPFFFKIALAAVAASGSSTGTYKNDTGDDVFVDYWDIVATLTVAVGTAVIGTEIPRESASLGNNNNLPSLGNLSFTMSLGSFQITAANAPVPVTALVGRSDRAYPRQRIRIPNGQVLTFTVYNNSSIQALNATLSATGAQPAAGKVGV